MGLFLQVAPNEGSMNKEGGSEQNQIGLHEIEPNYAHFSKAWLSESFASTHCSLFVCFSFFQKGA